MFTGIIEEVAQVAVIRRRGDGLVYSIKCRVVAADMHIGDSININGACQTVTDFDRESIEVEAIKETLGKTNLGSLRQNDRVNLERSLTLSSRLGGHLVSGHIDCVGEITGISPKGEQVDIEVKYPERFWRYLVAKGSIAMEGISLTVVDAFPGHFTVSLIPHTVQSTNLVYKKIGDPVNLEFDLIAKYIENMLNASNPLGSLTIDKLKEKGW